MVNIKSKQYYTVEDLLEKWNHVVTKQTVYQYVWSGRLKKAMSFGRKILFAEEEINRFENEMRRKGRDLIKEVKVLKEDG